MAARRRTRLTPFTIRWATMAPPSGPRRATSAPSARPPASANRVQMRKPLPGPACRRAKSTAAGRKPIALCSAPRKKSSSASAEIDRQRDRLGDRERGEQSRQLVLEIARRGDEAAQRPPEREQRAADRHAGAEVDPPARPDRRRARSPAGRAARRPEQPGDREDEVEDPGHAIELRRRGRRRADRVIAARPLRPRPPRACSRSRSRCQ